MSWRDIVRKEQFEKDKEAKPDYIDIDGDGDKTESMKEAAKDAKGRKRGTDTKQTGYCRRCQEMVTKYQRCNLSLPSPKAGIKPSCPMKEE